MQPLTWRVTSVTVQYITLEALPCFEEMVVEGAWWDYVDAVASRMINVLLKHHPTEMGILMREWAVSCGHYGSVGPRSFVN